MDADPVIEFSNCSAGYGRSVVLEDINLKVQPRETLCLVGPNGGGKSTLLKLIMGLLEPVSGSVRVLGTSPQRARTRIGYMPQQVELDPLFPATVESIILMGRLNGSMHWFYSREDRRATRKVIEETGLDAYRNSRFSELSGGYKQRVLIARAIVSNPEILLLDEPTAMVDAQVGAQLLSQLKLLHQKLTIILVSHDAAFVSGLVDEVFCVNRTAEFHPLRRVEDAAIQQMYGEGAQAVLHHHGHCQHHDHPSHD